jgi:hypothetical protein
MIDIKRVDKETQYAIISGIIEERGREVILNVSLGLQLCPTCGGTDPFCPTCDGNERIHIEQQLPVIALVRWKREDRRMYRPEGQYVEGDCTLVLLYVEPDLNGQGLLASGTDFIARRTTSVIVDDKRMVVDSYRRDGKPSNRVYLTCLEDDAAPRVS